MLTIEEIFHLSIKWKSNRRSLVTIAVLLLNWANAWPGCTTWWNSLSEGSLYQNRYQFWFMCFDLWFVYNFGRQTFPFPIYYDSLSLSSFGAPWEWSEETTEFLHRCILWCQFLNLSWWSKEKWKFLFSFACCVTYFCQLSISDKTQQESMLWRQIRK